MSFSDVLGILALAVAVIALPFTYWLARRGRQRPDLRYAIDTDLAIRPESDLLTRGLSIEFDGHQIKQVHRTYIGIWNRQGDLVRGSDIVPDDPLRVGLDEGGFLQARIVSMSRPQIKPLVAPHPEDPSVAVVSFDFLEARDGFVVELLHESDEPLELTGTIRGAPMRDASGGDLAVDLQRAGQTWRERVFANKVDLLVNVLFPVGFAIGTTFAIFNVGVLASFAEPRLVSPSLYDLGSLAGQNDFARAVRDAGNFERVPIFAVAGLLAMFLVMLYLSSRRVWGMFRLGVPAAILQQVDEFDQPSGSDS